MHRSKAAGKNREGKKERGRIERTKEQKNELDEKGRVYSHE
jgi:hypothetical protein